MTRQLFTITFVVLALATCCFAQSTINVRPVTQTDCSGSGLTWVSELASNYSTTPTVPTSICIFNDFETACPTLTGVVPCDRRAFTCHEWRGTNAWNAENVLRQWTATTAPSECLQFGTLDFHPDTSVVIVLQPLTSMLVFIGLAISAIVNFRSRVNWFSILIVVSMCIIGILQTVSYHYLNAYIVIAAGMIALAGYSRATPVSIGFGMFILLGAFYWVTFDTGLGHIQHHSRLLAGPSIADTYEIKCNTYYSGFFSIPRVLMKDTDNVQNQFFGYCNRAFLAAQLFLMIIQEYLLILLIAMGAFAITEPKAPANQAESEEATEAF